MRKSQRGVTVLGWVVLLIPVAIIGYAAHTPGAHLHELLQGGEGARADRLGIQGRDGQSGRLYTTRWSVASTSNTSTIPDAKDIDVHRDGEHWVAIAKYEEVAPLFGNLSLLVEFDKQVELK